ncbi:MAG TPA: UDP-2,3-diacylglucosamine diphosphatase [Steroidobacteraceae bacterium]|nr:UDP-2,3-diacylglucosamine diphosphatase [Steroidobacteraceae bacterium]
MTALFISDLHLDASRPDITSQFLAFLRGEAAKADALYILGDLFESWVGDDAADDAQRFAVEGLRELTSSGVPCFVMHGNRDFLMAERFSRETGAALLPDPAIITLYGERVLVMHGDALCTDDKSYQRLRATVRDADWQRRFLSLSAEARHSIAGAARVGSQEHTAGLEYAIADVNTDSVAAVLRLAGTSVLLHGHTHRPAIHSLQVDGRPCTRIVLGDWYEQGSVLRWDCNGPELATLARTRAGPPGP